MWTKKQIEEFEKYQEWFMKDKHNTIIGIKANAPAETKELYDIFFDTVKIKDDEILITDI